jgi:hypothetical protein
MLLKCKKRALCFLSIYSPVVNLCTIYCNIRSIWNFPRAAVFFVVLTASIDFPLNNFSTLAFLKLTRFMFYVRYEQKCCTKNWWLWSTKNLWKVLLMKRITLKLISKWMDTTTNAQYGRAAIWALIGLWKNQLITKKQLKCSLL